MSTHDMGIVAETADDVVVMRDGQVVEHRTAHDLFAAPREEYTRKLLESVPYLGQPERFDSIFVREPDRPADGADRPVVEVDDLTVTYRGRGRNADFTAVRGVSFDVGPGEIVGLVGESGSGKSTIGRAILGLNHIANGDVTILGTSVKGSSHRALRQLRDGVPG